MAVATALYEVNIRARTSDADESIDRLTDKVRRIGETAPAEVKFKNLDSLRDELRSLEKIRNSALDFDTAKEAAIKINAVEKEVNQLERALDKTGKGSGGLFGSIKSQFTQLKEDFKTDPFAVIGKGFVGSQVVQQIGRAFDFIKDKAAIADQAADQLDVALAKAGLTGAEKAAEIERFGKSSVKIADDFALSRFEVQKLQATVVGFSNLTGEQADHLTEIALGAANALGLAPEAVARLIAKGADPEAEAQLKKIGIAFDKNADAAERMATIEAKLGPTIQATKDSTQDAFGTIDRIGNKIEDFIIEGSAAFFEMIGTQVQQIEQGIEDTIDFIDGVGDAIGGAITDVGNFFGLISDVDAANQDAARTVENAGELYEEFGEKVKAADAALAAATSQSDAVKRFEELSSKASLNAKEQEELRKVNAELADSFPEAIDGVNDLTGEYDVNLKKLRELTAEEADRAAADKKQLVKDNLITPTADLITALDAQIEKQKELRGEFEKEKAFGDKDDILEAKAALDEQTQSIKGTNEQIELNIKALVEQGELGSGSAEEISKALNITRADAEKLVPKVAEVNRKLEEQKAIAKQVAESVQGIAQAFRESTQAANQALDDQQTALASAIRDRNKARREGNTEAAADAAEEIKRLVSEGQDEVQAVKDATTAMTEAKKLLSAETTKAPSTSDFEKRRKEIELDAKKRETDVVKFETEVADAALDAAVRGIRKTGDLTILEQAEVAERRKSKLEADRRDLEALARDVELAPSKLGIKSSEVPRIKADLASQIATINKSLQDEEKNIFDLKARFDPLDIANELQSLQDANVLKEVEIGFLPKEDAINVINAQLKKVSDDIAATQAKLQKDATGLPIGVLTEDFRKLSAEQQATQIELLRKLTELNGKRLDLTKDTITRTRSIEDEFRDAQIANISDAGQRELEELNERQARELRYFTDRQAAGIALTEREEDLLKQIRIRHGRERLDLLKKQYNEELDLATAVAKQTADAFTDAFRTALDAREKLTDDEIANRLDGFDQESDALAKSLQRGEISFEKYSKKVQDLAKKRADFEEELEDERRGNFIKGLETGYDAAVEAAGKYFDQLFQKYVIDAALTQIMEAEKTSAVIAGTAARSAQNEIAAASDLARAEKSGVAGATDVAASAIAALPFPVNLIAAAAASIAFSKIISGLTSLIKFEHGGLGLVGERGPEIIGPTKDFSQFATQLITQTVRATRQAVGDDAGGSGRGRRSRIDVQLKADLGVKGRDLRKQGIQETISSKLEQVG